MQTGTELTLDEMLADPIVRVMMRRDGVEETQVRALVRRVANTLDAEEPRSFAAWPQDDRAPDAGARLDDDDWSEGAAAN